jgi:hypothetical protein
VQFYTETKNFAQLEQVESILAQYEGRESAIIERIQTARANTPSPPPAAGALPPALPAQDSNAAAASVSTASAAPAADGGEGAAPISAKEAKQTLVRFYTNTGNTAALAKVDSILAQYKGREGEVVAKLKAAWQAQQAQAQAANQHEPQNQSAGI